MPHRSIILAIVAFWLGTSFWLFQREIRPRLDPGVPPRFALALTDENEVGLSRDKDREKFQETRWTVDHTSGGRDGKPITFTATTTVTHHDQRKEDRFDLVAVLDTARFQRGEHNEMEVFRLRRVETTYQVHRDSVSKDGLMIGLKSSVLFMTPRGDLLSEFTGQIRDGTIRLEWNKKNIGKSSSSTAKDGTYRLSWAKKSERDHSDGQVEVSIAPGSMVLLPQHPLERMWYLHPGRRWGMYLFDPLHGASLPGVQPRLAWVNAEVRAELETWRWHTQDRRCRVIDYEGDNGNIAGTIWVDAENDRVLRMLSRLGDDRWEITRE